MAERRSRGSNGMVVRFSSSTPTKKPPVPQPQSKNKKIEAMQVARDRRQEKALKTWLSAFDVTDAQEAARKVEMLDNIGTSAASPVHLLHFPKHETYNHISHCIDTGNWRAEPDEVGRRRTAQLELIQRYHAEYIKKITTQRAKNERITKRLRTLRGQIERQMVHSGTHNVGCGRAVPLQLTPLPDCGRVNASAENMRMLNSSLATLSNRCKKLQSELDKYTGVNLRLRREIDGCRQERQLFQSIFSKMDAELQSLTSDARGTEEGIQELYAARDHSQQEASRVHASMAAAKAEYEREWEELGRLIEQEKQYQRIMNRSPATATAQSKAGGGADRAAGKGRGGRKVFGGGVRRGSSVAGSERNSAASSPTPGGTSGGGSSSTAGGGSGGSAAPSLGSMTREQEGALKKRLTKGSFRLAARASAATEAKDKAAGYAEKWGRVQRGTGVDSVEALVSFFYDAEQSTFAQFTALKEFENQRAELKASIAHVETEIDEHVGKNAMAVARNRKQIVVTLERTLASLRASVAEVTARYTANVSKLRSYMAALQSLFFAIDCDRMFQQELERSPTAAAAAAATAAAAAGSGGVTARGGRSPMDAHRVATHALNGGSGGSGVRAVGPLGPISPLQAVRRGTQVPLLPTAVKPGTSSILPSLFTPALPQQPLPQQQQQQQKPAVAAAAAPASGSPFAQPPANGSATAGSGAGGGGSESRGDSTVPAAAAAAAAAKAQSPQPGGAAAAQPMSGIGEESEANSDGRSQSGSRSGSISAGSVSGGGSGSGMGVMAGLTVDTGKGGAAPKEQEQQQLLSHRSAISASATSASAAADGSDTLSADAAAATALGVPVPRDNAAGGGGGGGGGSDSGNGSGSGRIHPGRGMGGSAEQREAEQRSLFRTECGADGSRKTLARLLHEQNATVVDDRNVMAFTGMIEQRIGEILQMFAYTAPMRNGGSALSSSVHDKMLNSLLSKDPSSRQTFSSLLREPKGGASNSPGGAGASVSFFSGGGSSSSNKELVSGANSIRQLMGHMGPPSVARSPAERVPDVPVPPDQKEEEEDIEFALRDAKGVSLKPLTRDELHDSTMQLMYGGAFGAAAAAGGHSTNSSPSKTSRSGKGGGLGSGGDWSSRSLGKGLTRAETRQQRKAMLQQKRKRDMHRRVVHDVLANPGSSGSGSGGSGGDGSGSGGGGSGGSSV